MYKKATEEQDKKAIKQQKKQQKKHFKAQVKSERKDPQTRSNRRQTGKQHSEALGSITSKIIPGIMGAAFGGMGGAAIAHKFNNRTTFGFNPATYALSTLGGAGIGAAAGVKAAQLTQKVAGIIGKLRRVRTNKQQEEYQNSKGSTVANYLLPGAAAYNRAATDAANRDTLARLRQGKM